LKPVAVAGIVARAYAYARPLSTVRRGPERARVRHEQAQEGRGHDERRNDLEAMQHVQEADRVRERLLRLQRLDL